MEELRSNENPIVFSSDNNNASPVYKEVTINNEVYYFSILNNIEISSTEKVNAEHRLSIVGHLDKPSHFTFLSQMTPKDYNGILNLLHLNVEGFSQNRSIFQENFELILKAALQGEHLYLHLLAQLFHNSQSSEYEKINKFFNDRFENSDLSNDQLIKLIVLYEQLSINYGNNLHIESLSGMIFSVYMLRDKASVNMIDILTQKDCLIVSQNLFNDWFDQVAAAVMNFKDYSWDIKQETFIALLLAALNYQEIAVKGTTPGRPLMIPQAIVITVQMLLKASIETALKEGDQNFIDFTVPIIGTDGKTFQRTYKIPHSAIRIFYRSLHKLHLSQAIKRNAEKVVKIVEDHFKQKNLPIVGNIISSKTSLVKKMQPYFFSHDLLFMDLMKLAFDPNFINLPISQLQSIFYNGHKRHFDLIAQEKIHFICIEVCDAIARVFNLNAIANETSSLRETWVASKSFEFQEDAAIKIVDIVERIAIEFPKIEEDIKRKMTAFSSPGFSEEYAQSFNLSNSFRLAKMLLPCLLELNLKNFNSEIVKIGNLVTDFYLELSGEKGKSFFSENDPYLRTIQARLSSSQKITDHNAKKIIKYILQKKFHKLIEIDEDGFGYALYKFFDSINLQENLQFSTVEKILTGAVAGLMRSPLDQTIAKGLRSLPGKTGMSADYLANLIDSFSQQTTESLNFSLKGMLLGILDELPKGISQNLEKSYRSIQCDLFFIIIDFFCNKKIHGAMVNLINRVFATFKENIMSKNSDVDFSTLRSMKSIADLTNSNMDDFLQIANKLFEQLKSLLSTDKNTNAETDFLGTFESFFAKHRQSLYQFLVYFSGPNLENNHLRPSINNGLIRLIKFHYYLPLMSKKDVLLFMRAITRVQEYTLILPTESAVSERVPSFDVSLSDSHYSIETLEKAMRGLGSRMLAETKKAPQDQLRPHTHFLVTTVFQITGMEMGLPLTNFLTVFLENNCLDKNKHTHALIETRRASDAELTEQKFFGATSAVINKKILVELSAKAVDEQEVSPLMQLYLRVTFALLNRKDTAVIIVKYYDMVKNLKEENNYIFSKIRSVFLAQDYTPPITINDFFNALRSKKIEELKSVLDKSGDYGLTYVWAHMEDYLNKRLKNKADIQKENIKKEDKELSARAHELSPRAMRQLLRENKRIKPEEYDNIEDTDLIGCLYNAYDAHIYSFDIRIQALDKELAEQDKKLLDCYSDKRRVFSKEHQAYYDLICKSFLIDASLFLDERSSMDVTDSSPQNFSEYEIERKIKSLKKLIPDIVEICGFLNEIHHLESKLYKKHNLQRQIEVLKTKRDWLSVKSPVVISKLELDFQKYEFIDSVSTSDAINKLKEKMFESFKKLGAINLQQCYGVVNNPEYFFFLFRDLIQAFIGIYEAKLEIYDISKEIKCVKDQKIAFEDEFSSDLKFARAAGLAIIEHVSSSKRKQAALLLEGYMNIVNFSYDRFGDRIQLLVQEIRASSLSHDSPSSGVASGSKSSGESSSLSLGSFKSVKKSKHKSPTHSTSSQSLIYGELQKSKEGKDKEQNYSSQLQVTSTDSEVLTIDENLKKQILQSANNSMVLALKYCSTDELEAKFSLQFKEFLKPTVKYTDMMAAIRSIKQILDIVNPDNNSSEKQKQQAQRLFLNIQGFVNEHREKYSITRETESLFEILKLESLVSSKDINRIGGLRKDSSKSSSDSVSTRGYDASSHQSTNNNNLVPDAHASFSSGSGFSESPEISGISPNSGNLASLPTFSTSVANDSSFFVGFSQAISITKNAGAIPRQEHNENVEYDEGNVNVI